MILIAIFQLTLIVLVHELGHYFFARLAGVQVLSFNIGFGPALITRKYNGTEYVLRLFPLGGYVRLAGLDESQRKIPKNKTFPAQSLLKRFSIILGGALGNFLFTWLIFYVFIVLNKKAFWTGLVGSFFALLALLKDILQGIVLLITHTGWTELSGPLGIFAASAVSAKQGLAAFWLFAAVLSANLGIFNLLPLPGLDGGRLMFLLYELILRRKPNPNLEGWVHSIGFILLLWLIVLVSFQDVARL